MKPVILGMNNPHSADPHYALYPYPENSAGARLCAMFLAAGTRAGLALVRSDYVRGFDRRNLIDTPTWSSTYASQKAAQALHGLRDRTVVICGTAVLSAMKLRRHDWLMWSNKSKDLINYILVPHPSGRCREYNDPKMTEQVGDLLLELYEAGRCK